MVEHRVRFVKFGIASGIATLLDILLLWVLVEFFGLFYLFSAVVGFLAGSCLNYGINRAWAFKESKVANARGLISFIIIGAVGLIWTILLMAFFVEILGVHYLIARIISAFFVLVWNYVINSAVTFKYREKQDLRKLFGAHKFSKPTEKLMKEMDKELYDG